MKKLKFLWHRLQVWHIGILLLVIAVYFIIRDQASFIANIGTELASIAITILIIDQISKKNSELSEQKMLIEQLGSSENLFAKEAARVLRQKGIKKFKGISLWKANLENAELYEMDFTGSNLTYTTLRNANLNSAVLNNATLTETDFETACMNRAQLVTAKFFCEEKQHYLLKNADLLEANLSGATFKGIARGEWLEDEQHIQLQEAKRLCEAIMPSGKLYDGRYRLEGDLLHAERNGFNRSNNEAMARFYEVSVEEYLNGQEWYKKHGKSPADLIAWV